jgi:spore coat polysaccharide biosynthesis protein SpsF (cytidylyltransferase family)
MVVAFIQARLTSTRLPGKVLMDIGGMSSLARVTAAAEQIRGIDKVVTLWAHNFPEIPENDVLSRFYTAWKIVGEPRAVMRLTADCPLLDPKVCELVLESFLKYDVSYSSNVYPKRTFPDGLDCEVFSGELLARAYAAAESPEDREHVTPWMQRNATVYPVVLPVDWSHVRLTLDEQRDLDFLRTVVSYQEKTND